MQLSLLPREVDIVGRALGLMFTAGVRSPLFAELLFLWRSVFELSYIPTDFAIALAERSIGLFDNPVMRTFLLLRRRSFFYSICLADCHISPPEKRIEIKGQNTRVSSMVHRVEKMSIVPPTGFEPVIFRMRT